MNAEEDRGYTIFTGIGAGTFG